MRKTRLQRRSDQTPDSSTTDRNLSDRSPMLERRPDILDLQRQAGNTAVSRLLGKAPATESEAIQERLGAGQQLPGSLKARMESVYGADLSAVRVHTDSEAARLAAEQRTQALAVGQDIAFGSGAFKPGSPVGDALIAHELAHVVQQESSGRQSVATPALERDANRSAFAAVAGLWSRASNAFATTAQDARPRLRSAPQVLRAGECFSSSKKFDAPSYLGKHSLEALEDINRIVENTDMLANVIVYGTVVNIATSAPQDTLASGGHDVTPQAAALQAIPVIRRAKVNERIDFLLLDHGNDLNEEERKFWERVRAAINQSMKSKSGGAK